MSSRACGPEYENERSPNFDWSRGLTKSLVLAVTGVGSEGYAGDLTPPTIYVEEILLCISPPLEKT